MVNVRSGAAQGAGWSAIWRVALRHWRITVGCFFLGLTIAVAVTLLTPPTYRSTEEVQVRSTAAEGDAGTAYQGNLLAAGLVASYSHLMTGTVVVSAVVQELGLSEPVHSVQSRIQASPITDTTLISVTVSDGSAATAARIAESVVAQLHAYLVRLAAPAASPVADVIIVEPASVPTSPSDPQPFRNLGLGAVLGLLVGGALASWLDRRRPAPPVLNGSIPTALTHDPIPGLVAEPNDAGQPGPSSASRQPNLITGLVAEPNDAGQPGPSSASRQPNLRARGAHQQGNSKRSTV